MERESHLFWCLWGESLTSSGAYGERVSSLLVPVERETQEFVVLWGERESHLLWGLWGESLISSGAYGVRVSSLLVPV